MARSKKATRRRWFGASLLGGAVWLWQQWERGDLSELAEASLLVLVWVIVWVALLLPTTCDVITSRERPCNDDAFGRLRACHRQSHRRDKRRALLAKLGLRARAGGAAAGGAVPGRPTSPRSPTAADRDHSDSVQVVALARSTSDHVLLVATVLGTACGVVQVSLSVL